MFRYAVRGSALQWAVRLAILLVYSVIEEGEQEVLAIEPMLEESWETTCKIDILFGKSSQ